MGRAEVADEAVWDQAMIARTWRGETRAQDADAYVDYQKKTGIKAYRETEGNLGALMLRRPLQDSVEFLFISLWESLEAVRNFAGEDYERAVFYPADDYFLIAKDPHVDHYEVAALELSDELPRMRPA